MKAQNLVIEETSNLEEATDAGVIEVAPGQTEVIVEHRPKGTALLHSTGASDRSNCTFTLRHNNEIVYEAESPLGTVTQPFSFTDMYGEPIEITATAELLVTNEGDSTEKFAARWSLEVGV